MATAVPIDPAGCRGRHGRRGGAPVDTTETIVEGSVWLAGTLTILGVGLLLGLLGAFLVQRTLFTLWRSDTSAALLDRPRWQGRVVGALFGALVAVPFTPLEDPAAARTVHLLELLLVAGVAALLINVLNGVVEGRLRIERDLRDPHSRRRVTQLRLLRRVAIMGVVVLAASVTLLTFPAVRAVGASLLASAGLAGIIAGIAAQGLLRNVFAGIQIAFSEPLTINDDVVIEGEWGTVEEITLTHVVVRIWDWRRLVLPTSYFLETPFQNWTKNEARLIGSVHLRLDHRVPMDELRAVVKELAAASRHHDGDVVVAQVVESHDRTMEVRVLASAPDAPSSWDLRCEIREGVLVWLAQQHPYALPTLRMVEGVTPPPPARGDAAGSVAEPARPISDWDRERPG
ncbi:mechanosensitive ion channel family protein [Egicoccus halophilus]|uniref:Mechanosensitive ion channel MscS domain-containing protein n=1 Tax=Egicoccus halophilus TaxID=1670830 RepID=A0A8J3AI84_9ACTN|nr:mechanosensitive ion channel family protein [Egicoccus halophilus]GGI09491.1 hypothetical protein GCM10011354_34340 [Egicoccus halophilus]